MQIEIVAFVVGLFISNIALIIGAYVSIKVSIAELKTLVGILHKEVNILRGSKKYNQEELTC